MLPKENPSRTVHAVCAYWLMSSEGSSANAVRPQTSAAHARRSTRMSAADLALHPTLIGQYLSAFWDYIRELSASKEAIGNNRPHAPHLRNTSSSWKRRLHSKGHCRV